MSENPVIPPQALEIVKRFEGCVLTPYLDAAGKPTIGRGHLIKPGEQFGILTEAQADDLLREDMQTAAHSVDNLVKVPLNENQRSALISLVYNCGPAPLLEGLGRCLNAGDYAGCAARFVLWDRCAGVALEGLVRRREAEEELFNTPVAYSN